MTNLSENTNLRPCDRSVPGMYHVEYEQSYEIVHDGEPIGRVNLLDYDWKSVGDQFKWYAWLNDEADGLVEGRYRSKEDAAEAMVKKHIA